jgi:hypothetical protein
MLMNQRLRRWMFLLLVVILLGSAALLSRCGDDKLAVDSNGNKSVTKEAAVVTYPRDQPRPKPVPRDARQAPTEEPQQRIDRLTRATLPANADSGFVIEVNAIRHSPLADKLLRCRQATHGDEWKQVIDDLGIDPLEDIDRVGWSGGGVAVGGFFDKLKRPSEWGDGKAYGDKATVYHHDDEHVAIVGDDLVLVQPSAAELEQAIDRVEGRAPSASMPPGLQGEVTGLIGPSLIQMLGAEGGPQGAAIAAALEGGKVSMLVGEDAAMSLDVKARSEQESTDMAKAIGAGLAVARARASEEGDDALAALLEQATATSNGTGIAIDVAVTGDVVLKFAGCNTDGTPLPGNAFVEEQRR